MQDKRKISRNKRDEELEDLRSERDTLRAEVEVLNDILSVTEATTRQYDMNLRKSKDCIDNIIKSMIDTLVVITPEATIQTINQSLCDLLKYQKEELIGQPIRKIIPEEALFAGVGLKELMKKCFITNVEKTYLSKDDKKIPVLFSCSVMRDHDGKIQGIVCVAQDIRERKKMQQMLIQSEKLSSIGTFVAGVAHELNNPLTSILCYSESLLEEKYDLPDEVKNSLEVIIEQSHRTAKIVRELLKFSREQESAKTTFQVNDVIANTLSLQVYEFQANNIEFQAFYEEGLPLVYGDVSQIQQVFINIILNAYHAMVKGHGRGVLKVKTEKYNDVINIIFENNGPTIPEEIFNKLFDPFFTTKEVGEGTGLGLYVSHKIIMEHAGKIYAENVEDKGVRFTITLPYVLEETKKVIKSNNKPCLPDSLKILIVDDEESIRNWFYKMSTEQRVSVFKANNGKEAIFILEQKEVDVILSDAKMPEMDGFALLKWLEQNKPDYLKKFIFITGVIDDKINKFCNKYHCYSLIKPFKKKQVLEMIQKVAKNS